MVWGRHSFQVDASRPLRFTVNALTEPDTAAMLDPYHELQLEMIPGNDQQPG